MILRRALLYLSSQKHLRSWVESSSIAERLTKRFVAGNTLEDALRVARELNQSCFLVTLDHLGESVTSPAEAERSRDAYLKALSQIPTTAFPFTVSLKLSQFGMEISDDLCRNLVEAVIWQAKQVGTQVEIDMESSPYVDRTLSIVRDMHARHGCVRAVIQAYLYRSKEDVEQLCRESIPVRLCKGAYMEAEDVAFPKKADVDGNFVVLARMLLQHGTYPALATHDPRVIAAVRSFASELKLAPERYEFQMLYGIRKDLQQRLTDDGFRLRLYVPYGGAWYPYFMRRLAERPANLVFLLRNMFRS